MLGMAANGSESQPAEGSSGISACMQSRLRHTWTMMMTGRRLAMEHGGGVRTGIGQKNMDNGQPKEGGGAAH